MNSTKGTMIEAQNVWCEYGDAVVLENISVKIKEGEFITIVGASGCGKTTFLKMLLGIEKPSRGTILLDGKPICDEPNNERGIVFQQYSVFPHLSVLQNVVLSIELASSKLSSLFLGRLFGYQKRAAQNDARGMLESVGLLHAQHKYPFELSGGMRQRLAIAQSLIRQPRILLLDEPFGALDPGIRKDMHELILNLWQKTGITIFMISHDLKESFYLGTRLWVFDKKRLDPHEPQRFGSCITYDLPIDKTKKLQLGDLKTMLVNKT